MAYVVLYFYKASSNHKINKKTLLNTKLVSNQKRSNFTGANTGEEKVS